MDSILVRTVLVELSISRYGSLPSATGPYGRTVEPSLPPSVTHTHLPNAAHVSERANTSIIIHYTRGKRSQIDR